MFAPKSNSFIYPESSPSFDPPQQRKNVSITRKPNALLTVFQLNGWIEEMFIVYSSVSYAELECLQSKLKVGEIEITSLCLSFFLSLHFVVSSFLAFIPKWRL